MRDSPGTDPIETSRRQHSLFIAEGRDSWRRVAHDPNWSDSARQYARDCLTRRREL